MNRAARVRAVFSELRQEVSGQVSDAELIRAAADIVELMDPRDVAPSRGAEGIGIQPFEQWTVDRAMADGGWRVMGLENDVLRALYGDERDSVSGWLEVKQWLLEHAA